MSPKYMPTKSNAKCPVCDSKDVSVFFDLLEVPVNVCVQWPTGDEALQCPKGDIKLAFCRECSFIWNLVFDATRLDYSQIYENPLFYSPLFLEYTNTLVQRLISRYNLRNKDVIDIGCGKGDFLFLLCKIGNNRGVGFDTSYESTDDDREASNRFTIIRDFYSEKYAEYKADMICSRYVFEHIEHPKTFLKMLRKAIGGRRQVIIYFEVPNVSLILHDLSVWDIIYEHCSYFSLNSLERIFTLCGFDVLDLYESYEGQFLGIEATPSVGQSGPSNQPADNLQDFTKEVDSFVDNAHKQIRSWEKNLEALKANGKRAVGWGAGAKGVSFLNMLKVKDKIQYIVDINPRKHGKHVAGTGQKIVGPEFLRGYQPDVVIVMNPIYKSEIKQMVKEHDLTPQFLYA
jgi:SAM-dependent methyltransferase